MKKPKTHKIKEAPTTKMYRNPQKSKNKKLPYRQFKQSIHSNIMMASNPLTKQEKKKTDKEITYCVTTENTSDYTKTNEVNARIEINDTPQ